jgi:hypothetical protein
LVESNVTIICATTRAIGSRNVTTSTSSTCTEIGNATQLLKAYSRRVLQTEYWYENITADHPSVRFQSTQEIATHLCDLYFQLVHQQQEQRQVAGGGEVLSAQQEHILDYFSLELGAVNPTVHELDAVRAAAHDSTSLIRYETILQKRIRPMCVPQYERIFSSLLAHVGMKFLVQLRQDLLLYIHKLQHCDDYEDSNATVSNSTPPTRSEFCLFRLKLMNDDMKRMFSAWFSAGLLGWYMSVGKKLICSLFVFNLFKFTFPFSSSSAWTDKQPCCKELRRITYEDTAASIIEIVAKKESVHPIRSLHDLRTRLSDPHRRCFALFHPSLPNEPLVFVHVALLPQLPQSMQELEDRNTKRNTPSVSSRLDYDEHVLDVHAAVFYSINNIHKGLSGVDLGNFLIKRVVEVLKNEFASLNVFGTLSPLPNFRMWFKRNLTLQCQQHQDSTDSERDEHERSSQIRPLHAHNAMFTPEEISSLSVVLGTSGTNDTLETFIKTLESTRWYEQPRLVEVFQPVLMRHAAHYLVVEKQKKRPLDGVAKFHCRNGAEMYRLNFLADRSRTVSIVIVKMNVSYVFFETACAR